jgi:hypothetical protein
MTDSLSAYKQQLLNDFNNRPDYENEFHKQAATRLVELAKVRSPAIPRLHKYGSRLFSWQGS